MFDSNFFNFLQKNSLKNKKILKKAIIRSVELKAQIVIEDEKEQGNRAKLNYGHTYCHVIENETNYIKYLHGEAVSIGIIMANYLALKLQMINGDDFNKIYKLLQNYNLPTRYNIDDINKFYDKFYLDKKTSNGKIKLILPNGIGDGRIMQNIKEDIIKEALYEFNKNN